MKLLLIFVLLFGLTGCNNNDTKKDTINDTINDTKEQEEKEPETITLNEYGSMNQNHRGYYNLIFEGEKTFTVNDDYLIDMFALEFDEDINIDTEETAHLSGEFRYTYGGKNYVTKLNEINIGFFHMGEGGKDFFQIDVKGNQIRYWLYSTDNATLIIRKIWSFTPY